MVCILHRHVLKKTKPIGQENDRLCARLFVKKGLLPEEVVDEVPPFTEVLCQAVYAYLARTPCQLLAVPSEDLVGELDTPNVPEAPLRCISCMAEEN